MARHSTGTINGLHNITIFTRQWTPDNSDPRAIILLIHGYGEHSGRYQHVAEFLTDREYAVYALDHRGHGYSQGKPVSIRAFDHYVEDVERYYDFIRKKFPQTPVVVYGHSMGSLIALLFTLKRQSELAGVITTGTALEIPGSTGPMAAIAGPLSRVAPDWRVIPELELEGISRDPAVIEAYKNDPKVDTGGIRLRTAFEMIHAGERVSDRLDEIRIPFLALHGSEDPICLPKAIDIIRKNAPKGTTTVKMYEGLRHEIHNEPEHMTVLNDIADWLAKTIS